MPSLPPECLLVAAHASSLPPPSAGRGATSDASGRSETTEFARAPSPPSFRRAAPCRDRPPALPRSRSPLDAFLPPSPFAPRPLSSKAFGRVRVSSHSVPLGTLGAARCNGARTGGSLVVVYHRAATILMNCTENFELVTHRATRMFASTKRDCDPFMPINEEDCTKI